LIGALGMKKETVIAIAIIVALVSSLLYIFFTIQTPVTLHLQLNLKAILLS